MNIPTLREWQYTAMEINLKTVEALMNNAAPEDLKRYRDTGEGWAVVQVLGHLRDFEAVFFERARVTVEQETPPLRFPDPDELAAERDYMSMDPYGLLAEWQQERAAHIAYLKARSESDWQRLGQHPKRGPITLLDQLFLTPFHDARHIEQIARILAEKR